MKKNILGLIVLVALMFSACAQQKKTTASKVVNTKKENNNSITFLAMERTPCFGSCPAYRLELYSDGLVKFKSWSGTEHEGEYEKKFDAAKIKALYRKFEAHRVDTCAEVYENVIPDLPGLNFYFTYDGKEKQVMNAYFGPGYFRELANETDSFSKVDASWTKTADKK